MSVLNQSLNEMNLQNERLQREVQQSSGRIQELTRQLRETQTNCDSIALQRDNLQNRLEQVRNHITSSTLLLQFVTWYSLGDLALYQIIVHIIVRMYNKKHPTQNLCSFYYLSG